jgi:hypothetical protein
VSELTEVEIGFLQKLVDAGEERMARLPRRELSSSDIWRGTGDIYLVTRTPC